MELINILYEISALSITIKSNCKMVIDYCENIYKNMLVGHSESDKVLTIIEDNDHYEFIYPNGQVSKTDDIRMVFVWLNSEIKNSFHVDRYWPFHAGVLLSKDKSEGTIICGKSGSGKTTFCAQFVARGVECPTDDLLWINESTMDAYPMPVSMNLRDDVINIAGINKQKFNYYFLDIDGRRRWCLENNCDYESFKIRSIINVNYNKEKNYIRKLTTAEALKLILTNSYSALNMSLNHKMSAKIVKNISVYELYYTELNNVSDKLSEIMGLDWKG